VKPASANPNRKGRSFTKAIQGVKILEIHDDERPLVAPRVVYAKPPFGGPEKVLD